MNFEVGDILKWIDPGDPAVGIILAVITDEEFCLEIYWLDYKSAHHEAYNKEYMRKIS